MVAEFVAEREVERDEAVVFGDALDVTLRVADRAQIELVRALRELGDAREMEFVERFGFRDHLEALQILVVGGECGRGFRALSFLTVLLRPFRIFAGNGDRLKEVRLAKEVKILFRFRRKIRHGQVGDLAADGVALERIVVDENDAVHTDVQRLPDPADVAGLVFPVRHEHHEVVLAEHHFRVFAERTDRGVVFVFAAHCEQDSAVAERLEIPLEIGIDLAVLQFADADAFHAVIAHDAAPKGIVKVKDGALAEMPGERLDGVENALCDLRQEIDLDRHLGNVEKLRIEERVTPDLSRKRVQRNGEYLFVLGCGLGKQHVQFANLIEERFLRLEAEVAEHAVVDFDEVELEDRSFRPGFDPAPVFLNSRHDAIRKGFLFFRRQIAEFQLKLLRAKLNQDVIRLEREQFRIRVERLRFQLVVVGIEHIQHDLEFIRIPAQSLTQQLRRAVAEDRQFGFPEAGCILLQVLLKFWERRGFHKKQYNIVGRSFIVVLLKKGKTKKR